MPTSPSRSEQQQLHIEKVYTELPAGHPRVLSSANKLAIAQSQSSDGTTTGRALDEVHRLVHRSDALLGPMPADLVAGDAAIEPRGNNDHAPARKTKLFDDFWQKRMNNGIIASGNYSDAAQAGARWLRNVRI